MKSKSVKLLPKCSFSRCAFFHATVWWFLTNVEEIAHLAHCKSGPEGFGKVSSKGTVFG